MFYWMVFSYILFTLSCLTFIVISVIVTIGGAYDLKFLFKSLKEEVVDETDDGRINPT